MLSSPLAGAVGGAIVTIVTGVIIFLVRRRFRRADRVEQWYEDALGLVARLQEAAHRTTTYEPADYDALREKLDSLVGDIQEHAGSAPDGVDSDSRHDLVQLAAFSSGVIPLTEQSERFDGVEFAKLVQEYVPGTWSSEHDIKDVNALVDEMNVDALAKQITLEEGLEVDQQAADEFLDYFSDESLEAGHPTSIEEAVGMPLDTVEEVLGEGGFDSMMDRTMRQYVRLLLIEYSGDVFRRLEERKKRV